MYRAFFIKIQLLKFHNILKMNLRSFFSLLLILSFFASKNSFAQGNLLLNPKRVVFDGQKRSQEINLANVGTDTARYVISFIQIRMKADGSFEEITTPDSAQNFADKNLRVFPRTVVLGPNEAQLVKVQLSQTSKLLPGEYRSHLYFRALEEEKPLGQEAPLPDSSSLSVNLKAIFGISIPAIIRIGESTSQIKITDLAFKNENGSEPMLKARFNRTGNMSVYGDLTIKHHSTEGKVIQVGLVKGISVYTPNAIRDMQIKLDSSTGVNYKSGKLFITYTSQADEKAQLLATAELILK